MPENLSSLPLQEWINYSQPVDACSVRVIPPEVTTESILNHTAPLINSFMKCAEWDFDRSEVGDTIISEWSLVCDRASLTNLAEVLFLVGVGAGGVVGGWISDKWVDFASSHCKSSFTFSNKSNLRLSFWIYPNRSEKTLNGVPTKIKYLNGNQLCVCG